MTDENYLRRLTDEENMATKQATEVARVYRDVRNGMLDIHTEEIEKITGREPRSVEQFAIDCAVRFTGV